MKCKCGKTKQSFSTHASPVCLDCDMASQDVVQQLTSMFCKSGIRPVPRRMKGQKAVEKFIGKMIAATKNGLKSKERYGDSPN